MLDLVNKTRQATPRLPFDEIKKKTIGSQHQVSLVFIGDKLSKKLNYTYRQKNKPTNVLAFPYEKKSGEIFINLKQAKKEAPKFGYSINKHVAYLFIHGLLHLKGLDHSSRMEKIENLLMQTFFNDSNNRHRS